MFVEIQGYRDNVENTIILNVDRISSIRNMYLPNKSFKDTAMAKDSKYEEYYKPLEDKYTVIMDTKDEYILNKEQYEQMRKILQRG